MDTTTTENQSDIQRVADQRKLHTMAEISKLMKMWQQSENIHSTQKESNNQNYQMTAVGYISVKKEIVTAS